jgi:hypothetical protein
MIPPAVIGAKFLPMFLRASVFTKKEGLERELATCPAISAPRRNRMGPFHAFIVFRVITKKSKSTFRQTAFRVGHGVQVLRQTRSQSSQSSSGFSFLKSNPLALRFSR